MEPLPGTYALIIYAQEPHCVQVGRLGMLEVLPGWYIYVGSAFGPGGLLARVGRHLRGTGPRHWHIDYLLQVAVVEQVWYTLEPTPREHAWAQAFMRLPTAVIPLAGFGSSDCHCLAHLVYLTSQDRLNSLVFDNIHQLKLVTT